MLNLQSNDFLRTINIYGLSFPLRYRKSEKYSTISGIIFSILTFLIVISITIMYSLDLIYHTGFNIMLNYTPILKKTLIDFSKTPFMIGFVNWSRTHQKLNSSYLSLTFDKNVHNTFINKDGFYVMERISTPIKLEVCNPKIHYIGKNEFMNDFEYNKFLCPHNEQNLSLSGRFGDNINGYDILEIHLNKCENKSDNLVICKSNEEIDEYIKNSYLEIIYLSQSAEHNNYTYPITEFVKNELYVVAKGNTKRYYQYFSLAEYISDNGIFFKKKKKFSFFETENTRLDFVQEEDQEYYSSSALLEVAFTCTDRKNVYTRTYVKIQDVMRNIGGFIDLIYIIFQFICTFLSKKIMLLDIINHIILEDKYEQNIKGNIISKNTIKYNDIFLNGKNSSVDILNCTINKNENIIKSKTHVFFHNNFFNNKKKINDKNNNKNNKEYFKMSFIDYFLPTKILGKCKKYNWLFFYKKLFSQYMSLEVIIPIIERLTKLNYDCMEIKNNYFKLK